MIPMLIGIIILLSATIKAQQQPAIDLIDFISGPSIDPTIKAQENIRWFKDTQYHKQNVRSLRQGWKECPDWNILSIKQSVSFEGVEQIQLPKHNNTIYNITALCITLKVPLNWDSANPNGIETIDYHITRAFSGFNEDNNQNNGAFWMLQGGPGESGESLYPFVIPTMNFMEDEFDFYLPDQRGSGYSSYLTEEQFLNDTDYSQYFSAYSHAMDLGYAIDLFETKSNIYNDDNDIIYGVSYGTFYLNQYLILFPDQVNAAIFDGVVDPKTSQVWQSDKDFNDVALLYFERCQKDTFCKGKFDELGTTISDAIRHIIDQLEGIADSSQCVVYDPSVGATGFKRMLSGKLSPLLRNWIPSVIHKLYRCNQADIEWAEMRRNVNFDPIANTEDTQVTADGDNDEIDVTATNAYLTLLIGFSEEWEVNSSYAGPTYEEFKNAELDYLVSSGSAAELKKTRDVFLNASLLYEPNPLVYHKYADPPIPILILNGDLDPKTPHKDALNFAKEYGTNIDDVTIPNNKQRYFITMPNAGHGALFFSDIRNFTDNTPGLNHDLETCGYYIVKSFLDTNNSYIPNMDCIHWLDGLDFEGINYYAQFGVDIWAGDNTTSNHDPDDETDLEKWYWKVFGTVFIGIIFTIIIIFLLVIAICIICCLSCCLCSKQKEIRNIQLQINEDSV